MNDHSDETALAEAVGVLAEDAPEEGPPDWVDAVLITLSVLAFTAFFIILIPLIGVP